MQRRLVARRAISGCGPLTIHFPPLYSSAGAAVDDDDEDHQELRSFSLCLSRLEFFFFFFLYFSLFFSFYSTRLLSNWPFYSFSFFSWTLSLRLCVAKAFGHSRYPVPARKMNLTSPPFLLFSGNFVCTNTGNIAWKV